MIDDDEFDAARSPDLSSNISELVDVLNVADDTCKVVSKVLALVEGMPVVEEDD